MAPITNRNSTRTFTLAGALFVLAGGAVASPDLPGGWSLLLDDVREAGDAGQFDGIDIIDRPGNRDITGNGTVNHADIAGFFDSIGSQGQMTRSASASAQSYGDVVRFLANYAMPDLSDPFPPPNRTSRSASAAGLRRLSTDIQRLRRPGDVNADGSFDSYDTLEFFSAFELRSGAADMNLDDLTDYRDVVEFTALLQSASRDGNADRFDGQQQLTHRSSTPGPDPQPFTPRQINSGGSASSAGNATNVGDGSQWNGTLPGTGPGPDPQPFTPRQINSGGSASSAGNATNVGDGSRWNGTLPGTGPGPDPQPFTPRQINSGGSASSAGNATNVGDGSQWNGTLPGTGPGPDPQPFTPRQINSGGSASSAGNATNVGDGSQWDRTLPADLNVDGVLDNDDIREFFRRFISNDGTADFNADGGFTFEDVRDFMDLFNTVLP